MLRQTPNRRHRWLVPANSGLESSYESRPGYHPVEVHTQAGPTQVSLHNQAVEALEANCYLMKKRVVITGMGVVSPNGIGNQAFCRAILAGISGVKRVRSFDSSDLPVQK